MNILEGQMLKDPINAEDTDTLFGLQPIGAVDSYEISKVGLSDNVMELVQEGLGEHNRAKVGPLGKLLCILM